MAKRFLLVDSDVLPDVFMKVVKAKELLASGRASSCNAQRQPAGKENLCFFCRAKR